MQAPPLVLARPTLVSACSSPEATHLFTYNTASFLLQDALRDNTASFCCKMPYVPAHAQLSSYSHHTRPMCDATTSYSRQAPLLSGVPCTPCSSCNAEPPCWRCRLVLSHQRSIFPPYPCHCCHQLLSGRCCTDGLLVTLGCLQQPQQAATGGHSCKAESEEQCDI